MPIPPEQAAMAPFLHGWLAMEIATHRKNNPNPIMKIESVDIPVNKHGDYENFMIVRFDSGAAVKVTVEPFDADAHEIDQAIQSIKGD